MGELYKITAKGTKVYTTSKRICARVRRAMIENGYRPHVKRIE